MGFLDKIFGKKEESTGSEIKLQTSKIMQLPNLSEEAFFKECTTLNFKEEDETRTWSSEPEFSKILDPLNDGKNEIAIKESEKLVRKFSDFDLIYNWWASALLDIKLYEKAREVVQKGLAEAKRKYNLCVKAGEIEWKSGNLKGAVYYWAQAMHCQEPLKGHGRNESAYLYLHYVAQGLGLSNIAEDFVQRVDQMRAGKIRLDGATSRDLIGISQKESTPELKKVLEELDERYFVPAKSQVWNNEGAVLNGLGKYDEAIQAYEKAIEINPQYALAWNGKGVALSVQGKYDEAITAFDRAIEINPQDASAWNNKGNALDSQGKYDEAIQAYDKAIEIDPQMATVWNNKGRALKSFGRTAEADAAFSKAKELGYNG